MYFSLGGNFQITVCHTVLTLSPFFQSFCRRLSAVRRRGIFLVCVLKRPLMRWIIIRKTLSALELSVCYVHPLRMQCRYFVVIVFIRSNAVRLHTDRTSPQHSACSVGLKCLAGVYGSMRWNRRRETRGVSSSRNCFPFAASTVYVNSVLTCVVSLDFVHRRSDFCSFWT